MKEPLFRSANVSAAAMAVVMMLLLGLSLSAAYMITLLPPIARKEGVRSPFHPPEPRFPHTQPDAYDDEY